MPRAKIVKEEKKSSLSEAINTIRSSPVLKNEDELKRPTSEVVDIMTFCDDPIYLNLPFNKLNLWLSQRVILKCFYMGTIGNKELSLTQEEWEWLYANESDEDRDGVIYRKNIKENNIDVRI